MAGQCAARLAENLRKAPVRRGHGLAHLLSGLETQGVQSLSVLESNHALVVNRKEYNRDPLNN